MLDRILRYFVWESRAVTGAPVTFAAAVLVIAALISCAVIWAFRHETASLRQQVAEYREKLGGARLRIGCAFPPVRNMLSLSCKKAVAGTVRNTPPTSTAPCMAYQAGR